MYLSLIHNFTMTCCWFFDSSSLFLFHSSDKKEENMNLRIYSFKRQYIKLPKWQIYWNNTWNYRNENETKIYRDDASNTSKYIYVFLVNASKQRYPPLPQVNILSIGSKRMITLTTTIIIYYFNKINYWKGKSVC